MNAFDFVLVIAQWYFPQSSLERERLNSMLLAANIVALATTSRTTNREPNHD